MAHIRPSYGLYTAYERPIDSPYTAYIWLTYGLYMAQIRPIYGHDLRPLPSHGLYTAYSHSLVHNIYHIKFWGPELLT